MTATTNEVITALTKSVSTIDAARRVGWAKMFDAAAREEIAQKNLSIAKEDTILLAAFAGFLYGMVIEGLPDGANAAARHPSHIIRSALPEGAMNAGRELGAKYRRRADEKWQSRIDECTRSETAKANEWKRARKRERKLLAERYGIPDEAALLDWLAQYRDHHDEA
jgi:hypothetical protein